MFCLGYQSLLFFVFSFHTNNLISKELFWILQMISHVDLDSIIIPCEAWRVSVSGRTTSWQNEGNELGRRTDDVDVMHPYPAAAEVAK